MDVSERVVARTNDAVVKIEKDILDQAKFVAGRRGVLIVEYLSSILRPAVERDFEAEHKALREGIGPAPRKPRK